MDQMNSLNKSINQSLIDRARTRNFSTFMRWEGNRSFCISGLVRNAKVVRAELQPMRIATFLPHEAADAVNECLSSR